MDFRVQVAGGKIAFVVCGASRDLNQTTTLVDIRRLVLSDAGSNPAISTIHLLASGVSRFFLSLSPEVIFILQTHLKRSLSNTIPLDILLQPYDRNPGLIFQGSLPVYWHLTLLQQ